jgi:hypothetical protein
MDTEMSMDIKLFLEKLYHKVLNTLVVLGLIWICFALSFDLLMIYLHFFNPEVQSQLLKELRIYLYI